MGAITVNIPIFFLFIAAIWVKNIAFNLTIVHFVKESFDQMNF